MQKEDHIKASYISKLIVYGSHELTDGDIVWLFNYAELGCLNTKDTGKTKSDIEWKQKYITKIHSICDEKEKSKVEGYVEGLFDWISELNVSQDPRVRDYFYYFGLLLYDRRY